MPFQPGIPANPKGIGGFQERMQDRSDGRWSKENSFKYWMNYFKSLKVTEFKAYEKDHPDEERTVAESLAYARIVAARNDLAEFKEVADRTEGKARQTIEIEADVNVNTISNQEVAGSLQKLLEASEVTEGEVIPEVTTENTTQNTTELTTLESEPQWG